MESQQKIKVITKRPDGSTRVATINSEHSKTDQQFAKDCDINEIVRKFKKTGQLTHLSKKQGVYADVSQVPDLLTAYEQITIAENAFADLPSDVRLKFSNNPQEMINFLTNPQNHDEAVQLGLLVPPKQKNDDLNDDKSSMAQKNQKTTTASNQKKLDPPSADE